MLFFALFLLVSICLSTFLVSFSGVSEKTQMERIQNQVTNIEMMLDAATEDPPTWLLVVGHYPVFSSGSHGDIKELNRHLLPLLRRYNVHAYFSGHDHISEHLSANGTEYFVVGAGSMIDYLKYTSAATLHWYGVGYNAFAGVAATSEELTVSFVDTSNTVRYSYTLTNPNPAVEFTNQSSSLGDHHTSGIGGDLQTPLTDWSQRNAGSIIGSLLLVLGASGLLVALLAHKNNVLEQKRLLREQRAATRGQAGNTLAEDADDLPVEASSNYQRVSSVATNPIATRTAPIPSMEEV